MAKICKECSKKLPLFSQSLVCEDCNKLINEKYEEIKNKVLKNFDLKEEQANYLKDKFEKDILLDFYNEIYSKLLSEKEIRRNENRGSFLLHSLHILAILSPLEKHILSNYIDI